MKKKARGGGILACLMAFVLMLPSAVLAADGPYTDDVINQAFSQIYEDEEVVLKNIKVLDESGSALNVNLEFTLFDTTSQEFAPNVKSANGVLEDTKIIKGHHYILSLVNANYEMQNKYFTLDASGQNPKDDKTEMDNNSPSRTSFDSVIVKTRAKSLSADELKLVNRIPFGEKIVNGQLSTGMYVAELNGIDFDDFYPSGYNDITFKLVNQYETITLDVGDDDDWLYGYLMEDVNYSLVMESSDPGLADYVVLQNLVTVKDHSERSANYPRSTYTHYTCNQVEGIYIADGSYDDGKEIINDATYAPFVSRSGKSKLSGVRAFIDHDKTINEGANKDEFIFNERVISQSADEIVMDFDAINMHRFEICKLPYGDYTITTELPSDAGVARVYNVDANGKQVGADLKFVQNGTSLEISTSNVSLYNTVIEYPHTHELEEVQERPATCDKDGVLKHYRCKVCGALFLDSNGKTEVTANDVKIKATGHDYENGVCKKCGKTESADTADGDVQTGDVQTGDETNIALWLALATIALVGTSVTVVARKRRN